MQIFFGKFKNIPRRITVFTFTDIQRCMQTYECVNEKTHWINITSHSHVQNQHERNHRFSGPVVLLSRE